MEISQSSEFYEAFLKAVWKRMTKNIVVPLSGGLDSTLITKALHDLGLHKEVQYVTMYGCKYVDMVCCRYGIETEVFKPVIQDGDLRKQIEILEEPFYAPSVNYYLYKKIHEICGRVSLSGLGADEFFGGYDYYNTEHYPRGLFKEIKAVTNKEKRIEDTYFLTHHHLRENEKIGLYWQVEGRFPFLDKEVRRFTDVGKSMIKEILLRDFPDSFVNRKKEGFRLNNIKDRSKQRLHYLEQLAIWHDIFKI
jgi:asparagine synthetase B (glutamine-hydrolysing)